MTIVDLLVVRKNAAGEVSVDEFDIGDFDGISLSEKLDLVSAEDAETVGEGLAPETCAAVIVFEQTWAKGSRTQSARSAARSRSASPSPTTSPKLQQQPSASTPDPKENHRCDADDPDS